MQKTSPLIIESAVSDFKLKVPKDERRSIKEPTIQGALDSLDAGAAIIHLHHDRGGGRQAEIDQLIEVHREILAKHPAALMYPDPMSGTTHEEIHGQFAPLAEAGVLRMMFIEMGKTLLPIPDKTGLPSREVVNGSSFSECDELVGLARQWNVPLSLGIYNPALLYWIRRYAERGLIPAGTMIKLWLGGRYVVGTDRVPNLGYSLPATPSSVDIYLELMEGIDLPWMAAVQGDFILDLPVARHVLEQGGHLRVGIEDVAGTTVMSNRETVEAAKALANDVGRPVLDSTAARQHLGIADPVPV